MKIIVASTNPVKVGCVKQGFAQMFADIPFEIEGLKVPSGVPDQPMTDQETHDGAYNRATRAMEQLPEADLWVGVEGGINETQYGAEAYAWIVVRGKELTGKAKTSTFLLPPRLIELVKSGTELGYANDQLFSESNSKQKGGVVGSLTGGLLGREEYYVQAVVLALIPFKNPELYKKP